MSAVDAFFSRLGRLGRRLSLTPNRAGLLRSGAAMLLVLVVCALFWPDRAHRVARHAFGWIVPLLLLLLWGIATTQVARMDRVGPPRRRLLVAGFVALAVAAVFVPAFHSSDLSAYVTTGRLQQAYGLNPYVHVAADVPEYASDPALSGTWKDVPCTYGFLFARATAEVVEIADGDAATAILLFKILGAVVLATVAWLVHDLARTFGAGGRDLALLHLLWFPWALLHFVSNGHNDLWMTMFVLTAVGALHRGNWWGVVPALVLAALVKHLAVLVVPFAWIVLVRRHGWGRTILSTMIGAGLVVFVGWPYLGDLASFRWAQIGSILTAPWNSIPAAFIYAWSHTLGHEGDAFGVVVRLACAGGFAVFGLGVWIRALRRPRYEAQDVLHDAALVLFVLLCLFSAAWFPWYPGMFLPLALVLPREARLRRMALWVTAFQMLAFTPLAKARVLEAVVMLALPLALGWRATKNPPFAYAGVPPTAGDDDGRQAQADDRQGVPGQPS